jgi:micrococcal nuclease
MKSDLLYNYVVDVVSVYDGDTITVDIHVGFGIVLTNQKIRLYGINTPEVRGEERERGLFVRDWLRDKILGKTVILKTIKDKKGKYGRWLGIIYTDDCLDSINNILISEGLAKSY